MKDSQNQGQSQQGQVQQYDQNQLRNILQEGVGKFGSQSDANTYLQRHGLSSQFKNDNIEIYDESQRKLATVQIQQSGSDRSIKNITF